MMRSYLKDNDISIKNGTDVNSVMRDIMYVLLDVKSWTSAGKIRADRIDVDELFANSTISNMTVAGRVFAMEGLDAGPSRVSSLQLGQGGRVTLTQSCRWATITVDGVSLTVLCES